MIWHWQEMTAAALALLAAGYIVWRAWRALRVEGGCGGRCTCPTDKRVSTPELVELQLGHKRG